MTPKEKAEELVQKFEEYGWLDEKTSMWESAKQCAIIAVDEIIETFIPKNNRNYLCEEIEYWQQVRTEIQNL